MKGKMRYKMVENYMIQYYKIRKIILGKTLEVSKKVRAVVCSPFLPDFLMAT